MRKLRLSRLLKMFEGQLKASELSRIVLEARNVPEVLGDEVKRKSSILDRKIRLTFC